jgi:hypothetical protein
MPNLSISVDLGVSDIFSSIKDFFSPAIGSRPGLIQRGKDLTTGLLETFDTIMLRVIVVIILLATTVMTVCAIPHAAMIVEQCFIGLYRGLTMLQSQITPQNMLLINQWMLPVGLMISLL